MARKLTKKPTRDVYLEQVPEMPNLYCITNLAGAWEAWWRVLLAFHGPDYGVIIAGNRQRTENSVPDDDWKYVTRDDEVQPRNVCWGHEFSDNEAEDPYVYTNLNTLSEQPICIRFRPMLWVRSDEGWRVPMQRLLARGIRLYAAAEVEEARRRREEKLRWLKENLGPWMNEESW